MRELWPQLDATDLGLMPWAVVVGLTLIAAATDLRTRRIPNVLTFTGLLAGLIYAAAVGGWGHLGHALAGMLLCAMPFVLLFIFAGGGAGDAKLMAAVGAWLGLPLGLLALACVLIAGAVLAIGAMIWQRSYRGVWGNFLWILVSLKTAAAGRGAARRDYVLPAAESLHAMPYGIAIFVGCALAAGVMWL